MTSVSSERKGSASVDDFPVDEKAPLQPDRTFYIVPHTGFTKAIKVLDLTAQIKDTTKSFKSASFHFLSQGTEPSDQTPYYGFTDFYKKAVKELAENSPPDPTFTITRQNWMGSRMVVTDSSGAELAEWKAPFWSTSTTHLAFPANSRHSSHAIEMKPLSFWRRSEKFVKDSVTYTWEMESKLTSNAFTLYKIIGQKKVEVARYAQNFGLSTGGVLIMDSREVDVLIAVLTCVVMLKKKRQRDVERTGHNGGP